jgi:uncharacterized protein YciI
MKLHEILAKGKQYTLVFLKKGPHYDMLDPKELQHNQTHHLEYLLGLREKGILCINGPVTDECDIVGVSIYNSHDKDEIEALVSKDPGVMAGRFVYEIHTWFSFPGDKLA